VLDLVQSVVPPFAGKEMWACSFICVWQNARSSARLSSPVSEMILEACSLVRVSENSCTSLMALPSSRAANRDLGVFHLGRLIPKQSS
jgi:hypothetical protein